MKRSPMKPSTKPMSRGTGRTQSPAKKATLKTKGPRMTPIRRAARGQDCTLRIPDVCNFNPETTVLCHSNRLADGKGMGIKAPDTEACFGCSACHDVLDGRAPRPGWLTQFVLDAAFDNARRATHLILKAMRLIP